MSQFYAPNNGNHAQTLASSVPAQCSHFRFQLKCSKKVLLDLCLCTYCVTLSHLPFTCLQRGRRRSHAAAAAAAGSRIRLRSIARRAECRARTPGRTPAGARRCQRRDGPTLTRTGRGNRAAGARGRGRVGHVCRMLGSHSKNTNRPFQTSRLSFCIVRKPYFPDANHVFSSSPLTTVTGGPHPQSVCAHCRRKYPRTPIGCACSSSAPTRTRRMRNSPCVKPLNSELRRVRVRCQARIAHKP